MFLWPVFEYIKANRWAQIVLMTLAAIATLGIYLAIRDEGVKRRERARQEVERARERAKIAERRTQIKQEIINDSIRADEAVRSARPVDGPSQLRNEDPAIYDELFGTADPGTRRNQAGGV